MFSAFPEATEAFFRNQRGQIPSWKSSGSRT